MKQKSIGSNVTASVSGSTRSKRDDGAAPLPQYPFFAICVKDGGYPPFLEPGRAYKVIRPRRTDAEMFRVIDAEGEDYLYPRDWFVPVQLRPEQQRQVARALTPTAS